MKKLAMFLYLALVLAACHKDKCGNFQKSTIMEVEVKEYLTYGDTKGFVFLTNQKGKVIGSVEISNSNSFEIQNEIPFDGGAVNVNIALVMERIERVAPLFSIETYTDVAAKKIILGNRFTSSAVQGSAYVTPIATETDWYAIAANYEYIAGNNYECDSLNQHCFETAEMAMNTQECTLFARFFNTQNKLWRYGLLPLHLNDNITVRDIDLPYTSSPVYLGLPTGFSWCYSLSGALLDDPNSPSFIRLNNCHGSVSPENYHLLVPSAVFEKFETFFSLRTQNETYYYGTYSGTPALSYYPDPIDFEASFSSSTTTLVKAGSADIDYYALYFSEKSGAADNLTWKVFTDLSTPYKSADLPEEILALMSTELRKSKLVASAVESVRDSRHAGYQDFMEKEIVLDLPYKHTSDFTYERQLKEIE